MRPVPAAGILIGVLCGAWMLVMGATGWYKDPSHTGPFVVVILIEIAGLIWGLRHTAAEGRTYSGQVVAGMQISCIAGLIIIVASFVFTMVFPEAVHEIEAASREILRQQGRTDPEISAELSAWAAAQTPLRQAMNGFFGTFTTGVVVSAVVSIWLRAKRTTE